MMVICLAPSFAACLQPLLMTLRIEMFASSPRRLLASFSFVATGKTNTLCINVAIARPKMTTTTTCYICTTIFRQIK